MKSVTILGATYNPEFDRVDVVKSIVQDDDTVELNLHSISTATLEWKAAECGITDINLLLDAILFEPFVDQSDPRDIIEKTQDFKSKKVAANHNKSTAKTALRAAKVGTEYVNAVDNDAYELLIEKCPFNTEVIEVIAKNLQKSKERAEAKTKTKTKKIVSEEDRVANIRRVLDRQHPSDRGGRVVEKKSSRLKTIELDRNKKSRNKEQDAD